VAYHPLTVQSEPTSEVTALIRRLEDHYFRDVHAMLRLPAPDIDVTAGCNFAIAQVLLAVVSGVSTTLYAQAGGSGARFKGLLAEFYPWDEEPGLDGDPREHARRIYALFRNPLTHDLGLDLERKRRTHQVVVKRLTTDTGLRGRSEAGVESLEQIARPSPLSPVLRIDEGRVVLLVDAMYWGIRKLIVSLSGDRARMARAESFLAAFGRP
jgi:hypothetical protein